MLKSDHRAGQGCTKFLPPGCSQAMNGVGWFITSPLPDRDFQDSPVCLRLLALCTVLGESGVSFTEGAGEEGRKEVTVPQSEGGRVRSITFIS